MLTLSGVVGLLREAACGGAARAFLEAAWGQTGGGRVWTANAIRFVGLSYATDPVASRAMLRRILDEGRFRLHAHEEAPWLADAVPHIAPCDPEFVVEIYATLFGRSAPSSGRTEANRSRILPLTSTREQDYGMALHHLRQALPDLLRTRPSLGVRAINAALGCEVDQDGKATSSTVAVAGGGTPVVVAMDLPPIHRRGYDGDEADEPGELSGALGAFLAVADADQFSEVVDAAGDHATAGAVWARVLDAARGRRGPLDDRLWRLASSWEILQAAATTRAAVDFVAWAYESRTDEERRGFERMALRASEDGTGSPARRRTVARIASTLPEGYVATEAFRELRARMEAAGEAPGNPPLVTIETSWRPVELEDLLSSREGFDPADPGNRSVLDGVRRLDRCLADLSRPGAAAGSSSLWGRTSSLVAMARRATSSTHPAALAMAWHSVGRAVRHLAGVPREVGDAEGRPDPDDVAALAFELVRDTHEAATRADAAAAVVSIAPRCSSTTVAAIVDGIEELLSDPVPMVRWGVAERLHLLSTCAPEAMWPLLERVAASEVNADVIASVVAIGLRPLRRVDPRRVEAITGVILRRVDAEVGTFDDAKALKELDAALGALASDLAIGLGRPEALEWVTSWTNDLPRHEARLSQFASSLRTPLFSAYRAGTPAGRSEVWERTRGAFLTLTDKAAAELRLAREEWNETGPEGATGDQTARFAAAEAVLHQCCSQVFFGSGAHVSNASSPDRPAGLSDVDAKRRFMRDFRPALDAMGMGMPRTIHILIKTYAFLVEGDPASAFDAVSRVVTGTGVPGGYHLEQLAAVEVIRFVKLCLADHRGALDDEARRGRMLGMLELLARTGWPEALRLLHDVPDLLR